MPPMVPGWTTDEVEEGAWGSAHGGATTVTGEAPVTGPVEEETEEAVAHSPWRSQHCLARARPAVLQTGHAPTQPQMSMCALS